MTDHTKLKALALAATRTCPFNGDEIAWFIRYETFTVEHADDVAYIVEASPAAVLDLIADLDRKSGAIQRLRAERDALRTQVDALSKDKLTLWMILDDVDTAGDIAKGDDKLYRALCEQYQAKRWWVMDDKAVDAAIDAQKGKV